MKISNLRDKYLETPIGKELYIALNNFTEININTMELDRWNFNERVGAPYDREGLSCSDVQFQFWGTPYTTMRNFFQGLKEWIVSSYEDTNSIKGFLDRLYRHSFYLNPKIDNWVMVIDSYDSAKHWMTDEAIEFGDRNIKDYTELFNKHKASLTKEDVEKHLSETHTKLFDGFWIQNEDPSCVVIHEVGNFNFDLRDGWSSGKVCSLATVWIKYFLHYHGDLNVKLSKEGS